MIKSSETVTIFETGIYNSDFNKCTLFRTFDKFELEYYINNLIANGINNIYTNKKTYTLTLISYKVVI